MIAIVAAIREEVADLLNANVFQRVESQGDAVVFEGEVRTSSGRSIPSKVLLTGIGRTRAEDAIAWLMRGRRPDAVVSVGFGGATKLGMSTGAIAIASDVSVLEGPPIDWSSQNELETLKCDSGLVSKARMGVELSGIDYVQGPIVTAPIIVKSPGLKSWLGERFSVYSVDLETFWIAKATIGAGVPFLAARSIVDTSDMLLSDLVTAIPGAPTSSRMRAAIAYTLRNPGEFREISRLRRASSRAAVQLSAFLNAFSSQLLDSGSREALN